MSRNHKFSIKKKATKRIRIFFYLSPDLLLLAIIRCEKEYEI